MRGNPHYLFAAKIGIKITIYAKDPSPNATRFEHEDRAAQVRDMVVVALHKAIGKKKNRWSITHASFTEPQDLVGSPTPGGAVYELQLWVDRGIYDRAWDGSGRPSATLADGGGLSSTTKVSLKGDPNDTDHTTPPSDAETSCGS